MSVDTLTTNAARQKIAAMAWQNIVAPMELLQVKLEAELAGEKLSKDELMLRALQQENERLEMQKQWAAALAVAMMYEKYAESREDTEDE